MGRIGKIRIQRGDFHRHKKNPQALFKAAGTYLVQVLLTGPFHHAYTGSFCIQEVLLVIRTH